MLQINSFSSSSFKRCHSTNTGIREKNNLLKQDDENVQSGSPRGSFQKFRELLKSNNLVAEARRVETPRKEVKNIFQEPLTGSKMSSKTNCDTEVKEEILRPKADLSPNLRYKEMENQDQSSPENKIIITDELKFSN